MQQHHKYYINLREKKKSYAKGKVYVGKPLSSHFPEIKHKDTVLFCHCSPYQPVQVWDCSLELKGSW